MIRGISFLSVFLMCLLMLGNLQGTSTANAEPIGKSVLINGTDDQSAGTGMVQAVKYYYRRHHHYRHYPIYPFYFGPYYYYEPYYSYPYYGYRSYGGRCSYWRRRCAENWGFGGSDYYGCLRYEGCW